MRTSCKCCFTWPQLRKSVFKNDKYHKQYTEGNVDLPLAGPCFQILLCPVILISQISSLSSVLFLS